MTKLLLLFVYIFSFQVFGYEDRPNYLLKCKPEFIDYEYGVCTDTGDNEFYDQEELDDIIEEILEDSVEDYAKDHIDKSDRDFGKNINESDSQKYQGTSSGALID